MSVTTLFLPLDIPWKRRCVSDDMIDRELCEREFPYRWRSSIAVFDYEPPEEHQTYGDDVVSYLKVVCSITGFQEDPEEVGLKSKKLSSYWNDPAVIENFTKVVTQYYACYGAILEVSVGPRQTSPNASLPPLSAYPYFADLSPKKRELYELRSETGERMSRSLENINVRKGTTTTDSHEVLDVDTGFSQSAEALGIGAATSFQGEWGTRDMTSDEMINMRTTDSAREQRETFSHSTQLTQMYHQLNSYHLGTNRAVFFMLPRPHIIESERTFVNGPRVIEGIQEFFLVVVRPKSAPDFCVEAYLETGHIASVPQEEYETSTAPLDLTVQATITEEQGDQWDCWDCYGDDSRTIFGEGSETYNPPQGWEIDLDRNGGFKVESQTGQRIVDVKVEASSDHVTAWGMVSAWFQDEWPDNYYHNGFLNLRVTVYIRNKTRRIVGYDQALWLTGRGVCCCAPLRIIGRPIQFRPSITYEEILDTDIRLKPGGNERMPVADANKLRHLIGTRMFGSRNHPERYPRGKVGFLDAQFVGRTIARLVRRPTHPENNTIASIAGLKPDVLEKIRTRAPRISRGKLLSITHQEVMDRFGLSDEEATHVRRAALGLAGEAPEPSRRWDRPGVPDEVEVPNVVGLSLAEARKLLLKHHLRVGDLSYKDSDLPTDTVLEQGSAAVQRLRGRSHVDLVLATGLSVRIPDLVGLPLSAALGQLTKAGLVSEPEVETVHAPGIPAMRVLAVTPEPRSYVTPHAAVSLQVSAIR